MLRIIHEDFYDCKHNATNVKNKGMNTAERDQNSPKLGVTPVECGAY